MSMPAARDAMSITASDWFVSVEPGIAAGEFGLIRPRFIFRNSVPYFSASYRGRGGGRQSTSGSRNGSSDLDLPDGRSTGAG